MQLPSTTVDKRTLWFSIACGLFFSTLFTLGNSLYRFERLFFGLDSLAVFLVSSSVAIVVSLLFFAHIKTDEPLCTRKDFELKLWQPFILIFLSWVPAFLNFYPGLVAYDTPDQFNQIFTDTYNNVNPIIHTLIIKFFLVIGSIFNNLNLGVALYSVFQMAIFSLSCSLAVLTVKSLTKSKILTWGSVIFFAVLPVFHLFSIHITKDVLFSAVFLITVTILIKIVTQPHNTVSKSDIIKLGVCFMLVALFRSNGLLAFMLFIPLVLFFKDFKAKVTKSIIWGLALYFTILLTLTYVLPLHAITVPVEGQSVFLQQLARTAIYNPQSFTEAEANKFSLIVPPAALNRYQWGVSDPIKRSVSSEFQVERNKEIFPLWATVGLKNPKLYLESFLLGNFSFWYPNARYPIPETEGRHPLIETKWHKSYHSIGIVEVPVTYGLRDFYTSIGTNEIQNNNGLFSLFLTPGIYIWVLFLSVFKIMYAREYYLLPALLLPLCLFLTILLGPIALLRYALPIILCAPIAVGIIFKYTNQPVKEATHV